LGMAPGPCACCEDGWFQSGTCVLCGYAIDLVLAARLHPERHMRAPCEELYFLAELFRQAGVPLPLSRIRYCEELSLTPCWIVTTGMRDDRFTWGNELCDDYWSDRAMSIIHRADFVLWDPYRRRGGPWGTHWETQRRLVVENTLRCHQLLMALIQEMVTLPFVICACKSGHHRSVAVAEMAVAVMRVRCPWRIFQVTHLEIDHEWRYMNVLDGLDILDHALQCRFSSERDAARLQG